MLWLVVTVGNLKAQVLSTEQESVDTVSIVTEQELISEKIANNQAKLYVVEGTEISNENLITNTEIIVVPGKIGTSPVKSKKSKTSGYLAAAKIKQVEYKLPVLKNKGFFKASAPNSEVYITYKEVYKSFSLPQNKQVKEKKIIQNAHVGICTFSICENIMEYVYLQAVPDSLRAEFFFTRPPPGLIS